MPETERKIINLLKKQRALSVEYLVDTLFRKDKITEREVKEAIWALLENRKIQPNYRWEMEYID